MKAKYNRIISCILAVFMLFSGMCLEEKADPLFEWDVRTPFDSFIDMLDKNEADIESCTIDMLGVHDTARVVSTVKRSNLKVDVRIIKALMPEALFRHSFFKVHFAADEVNLKARCYSVAILNFIHEKDGKK